MIECLMLNWNNKATNWKKVARPLWVSGETLPQVAEFKYLGVSFTSEGMMEHEIICCPRDPTPDEC